VDNHRQFFEPFFTPSQLGKALEGLGLRPVQNVVNGHCAAFWNIQSVEIGRWGSSSRSISRNRQLNPSKEQKAVCTGRTRRKWGIGSCCSNLKGTISGYITSTPWKRHMVKGAHRRMVRRIKDCMIHPAQGRNPGRLCATLNMPVNGRKNR